MSTVRIVMREHGKGSVFLDGVKLDDVMSLQVSCGVDQANAVTLTLIPKEIEIEGEFDVTSISSDARTYKVGSNPDAPNADKPAPPPNPPAKH